MSWAKTNGLYESTVKPEYLWVDVETTGLDLHSDVVLEIGAVLTDAEGYVCADPVYFLIRPEFTHPERNVKAKANMSEFVGNMHTTSRLWDAIIAGPVSSYEQAEADLTAYMEQHCENPKTICMAGSSVKFDYYMLWEFMPKFVESLHYRTIDTSSVKELCARLNPQMYAKLDAATKPKKLHRVLPDLVDTLNEYAFYRDNFLFY